MSIVVKEFGLGATQGHLTKVLFEQRDSTTFLLFFEWIYPQLDYTDFLNVVGISFKKFVEQTKFRNGLTAFASYLITLMKEKQFDEVDINFVLVKLTKKSLFISRFGDLDIYMFNQSTNTLKDISQLLPYNTSLSNLEFLKTDFIEDNLLLISNFGVVSNLFESNLLNTSSTSLLFKSLSNIKESVLESKSILLVGKIQELSNNVNSQQSSVTVATQTNDNLPVGIEKFKQSFLEKLQHGVRRVSKGTLWVKDKIQDVVIPSVTSQLQKVQKKFKPSSTSQLTMVEHESLSENRKTNNVVVKQNQQENVSNIDALTYFKLKRTWHGRLKLFILKFGRKLSGKFNNVKIFNKNSSRIFILFFMGIIGILALVFLLMQYRHIKKLRKQDEAYKEQIQNSISHLAQEVNKLEENSNLQSNVEIYQTCNQEADTLSNQIKALGSKVNFAETRAWLNNQDNKIHDLKNKCLEIYKKAFNIIDLSFEELKDFKATFGDQSQITNVNVYKGVILVVDKGRKVVYQINPANGKAIKLKDPDNKLKEPYKVGFGEAQDGTPIIFVCDRQNGILFYNSNTGFNAIPGTDNVAMGASCTSVGGFGTKAYFTTENGDAIYKLVNIGGGYAFPKAYVSLGKSSKIVDFAIDGSIYVLGQYPKESGYMYDILKFYGGQKDNFILSKADKMRMQETVQIFSNPSGYKPLYIFDKQTKMIYVMEKPTYKKHPGVGTFIKTYDLSGLEGGNITSFAVELSVNNNQETYIYVVANDKLFKASLK